MEGDYKEFVKEVLQALRADGYGSSAFRIWILYCAGELTGDHSAVIEARAAGGPVATAINLILREQRQPAALPVRCEHGRRWGLEMCSERCDCDKVDAPAVAPCKHCGRHDCQNSATAATARSLTAEQRRADPELADRVDRDRRLAGADCRRHAEAARSATLDQVVGETIAEVRNALMLPLACSSGAIADEIARALAQIAKLDAAATRYHVDHANLVARTPADVPIEIPATPMRPDPVASMPDALTWHEYMRANRDIFRVYGGPVAMSSRPEWRQAGWHDRPTIEDGKQ